MAYAALPGGGLYFPRAPYGAAMTVTFATAMAAASRRTAMIGHLYIEGRAASKTLSTGKIWWKGTSITFANAGTSIDVGIQAVDNATGVPARPEGTFSVKKTLVGGTDTLTNTWQSTTMNSGSATLSHGDLIAIVWDMTARGGADTVSVAYNQGNNLGDKYRSSWPAVMSYNGTSWSWSSFSYTFAQAVIEFDDGTLGTFFSTDTIMPIFSPSSESFTDATNPDERGMLFQVPWNCKIDALYIERDIADATSNANLILYSDPLGTPTSMVSISVPGTFVQNTGNADQTGLFLLATEIELAKNTTYCLAQQATGSAGHNYVPYIFTLWKEAYRVFMPGTTNMAKATRNNGSGAFTAESPAVTHYRQGIRISQINDQALALPMLFDNIYRRQRMA